MHLLTTSSANLDEIVEAVDLAQSPGDIVVLSFADSDLAGLAAAWQADRDTLPSVRLAHLRDLRHPMSVDLWIERVAHHAKVIVVRLLGGLDWWKYGIERLSVLAREKNIALAVLPGEDRDDTRLAAASTLPNIELDTLLRFFREGGRENLRALLRRLARHAGPLELQCRTASRRNLCRALPAICRAKAPSISIGSAQVLRPASRSKRSCSDHFLSRHAARRRHRANRCALHGARQARHGAGGAGRSKPEVKADAAEVLRDALVAASRSGRYRHDDRVRGRRTRWRADAAG